MRLRRRLLAACIFSSLLPAPLLAQTSSLLVRVRSPTGAVGGAVVEVFVAGTSLAQGWTDDEGELQVSPLPAGTYRVEVTAFGYNRLHMDGQIVDVPKSQGGYDDNPDGSGPGGEHMKFAARLLMHS